MSWKIEIPHSDLTPAVNGWIKSTNGKLIPAALELGYLRLPRTNENTTEAIAGFIADAVTKKLREGDREEYEHSGDTSSGIGASGEAFVREVLETVGGLSGENHRGDIHACIGGISSGASSGDIVLIEVKNYKKTVPLGEIDKFHRDLADCPHARAGLMISLGSPIAKTPSWSISWRACRGKSIPCVYVHSALRKDIAHAYRVCVELAQNAPGVPSEDSCRRTADSLEKALRALRIAHERILTGLRAQEEELEASIAALSASSFKLSVDAPEYIPGEPSPELEPSEVPEVTRAPRVAETPGAD